MVIQQAFEFLENSRSGDKNFSLSPVPSNACSARTQDAVAFHGQSLVHT